MAYPYYLPDERITLVLMLNSGVDIPGTWRMMQDIVPIVSSRHAWSGLAKEQRLLSL
jgi:D-alanyl-D-alanine carboxypeptidase